MYSLNAKRFSTFDVKRFGEKMNFDEHACIFIQINFENFEAVSGTYSSFGHVFLVYGILESCIWKNANLK